MRAAGTWWLGLGLGLGAALAALSPLGSARLGATPAANPSPARPLPAEVRSCGAGAGTGAPPPPQEAAGPSSPFPPHAMRSGRGPGAAGAGQSPRETPLGAGGGEGSRAPGPPRLGTPGSANPVGRDPQPPAPELWDPWDPLFGGSGPPGLQTQGPQDPGPAPWSCSTYGTLQAQSTWSPQVHKMRRLGASQPHTPQLQDPWDPYPGITRPQVCKPRRLRTPRLTSQGATETPSLPQALSPGSSAPLGSLGQGIWDPAHPQPGIAGLPGLQGSGPPNPCAQGPQDPQSYRTHGTHILGLQDPEVHETGRLGTTSPVPHSCRTHAPHTQGAQDPPARGLRAPSPYPHAHAGAGAGLLHPRQ